MICKTCGNTFEGNYCDQCGSNSATRVCSNCGAVLRGRYCNGCGADSSMPELPRSKIVPPTRHVDVPRSIPIQQKTYRTVVFDEQTDDKPRKASTFAAIIGAIGFLCVLAATFYFASQYTDAAPLADTSRNSYTPTSTTSSTTAKTLHLIFPADLPLSGERLKGYYPPGLVIDAPFTVSAPEGAHYYIVLRPITADSETGDIAYFLRGGKSLDVDVPRGNYKFLYACGTTWYGEKMLFGQDTAYYKAEEDLSFYADDEYVHGHTISLSLQTNGNFSTSSIDADEFLDGE